MLLYNSFLVSMTPSPPRQLSQGLPANARVQSVKSLSTVSGYGKYGDSMSVSADHKSGRWTLATLTSQVTNLILKKLPHRTHHAQNKNKRGKVVDTLANLQTMKSPRILCTPRKRDSPSTIAGDGCQQRQLTDASTSGNVKSRALIPLPSGNVLVQMTSPYSPFRESVH